MDNVKCLDLIVKLEEIGAIKFGHFELKSGLISPVYVDLRLIISYPSTLLEVSRLIWELVESQGIKTQRVCGVPYTALPIASCICTANDIPMLIRRKEAKDYGTKKMLEGVFHAGENCLIVEDVVSTGGSVLETAQLLRKEGLEVTHAIVLVNRDQGGEEMLRENGIELISVIRLPRLLEYLCVKGKVSSQVVTDTQQFLSRHPDPPRVISPVKTVEVVGKGWVVWRRWSYLKRAESSRNPVARRLLHIMHRKETNLCLSADFESSADLLDIADKLGPMICCLKTHADMLGDFSVATMLRVRELADKHDFILFEDRKFADIGNTVKTQFAAGALGIGEWAHMVNAHSISGPGIVQGLERAANLHFENPSACLLIAEMSSKGNLIDDKYKAATVKMAEEFPDFVIGFICQSRISDDPAHIHFTPAMVARVGVKLQSGQGDGLGQQYLTPHEVIANRQCDVIIVGRGIVDSVTRVRTAQEYRKAAWNAYQFRMTST